MKLRPRAICVVVLCLFAFAPVGVAQTTRPASGASAYLFTYFVGNGEDGLHLAASDDGYKFEALKGGKSVLTPTVGESKLMRDPCVVRGPDGTFHMVWTTASEGKTIGYASSKDLLNWSEQRAIPVMADESGVINCWAPEIVYDDAAKDFVIFWASTVRGKFPETLGTLEKQYNHRMYFTRTKDFTTFAPTKLLYDPGFGVIDATFLKDRDGKLHLIVKDETAKPTPKKHLRITPAESFAGPFGHLAPPFTKDWVEGPTATRVGDDYVVYFDCYRDHHYGAMRSRDLKVWEDVAERIAFPKGARHGTVIDVPRTVVDALR
jgi:beta-xylosidase